MRRRREVEEADEAEAPQMVRKNETNWREK
jgi:hypothetical protein